MPKVRRRQRLKLRKGDETDAPKLGGPMPIYQFAARSGDHEDDPDWPAPGSVDSILS